ncbi:hypothetical protein AVEN_93845-1 [Araneus ventricosus]|uniref:Uncharacterized protein n=1 Tax=Araneus ventricosus TaxID=182803 RepID=A0A4Y2AYD7_ARAVE|nr:hypothetical protein AVEN_93845-1 [Araneus ventricosus]
MTVAAIASSTEAGVLAANHLAMAQPFPKEVRTITGGGTLSPTITIPTEEATSCLLIRQLVISVYSRCPLPVSRGPNALPLVWCGSLVRVVSAQVSSNRDSKLRGPSKLALLLLPQKYQKNEKRLELKKVLGNP